MNLGWILISFVGCFIFLVAITDKGSSKGASAILSIIFAMGVGILTN